MHTNEFFSRSSTPLRYGRRAALDGIWMHEDAGVDAKSASSAEASGKLNADAFAGIVAATPLIAIDLIVEDAQGKVLLGLRRNPPAQDFWFVPGGRVRKGETLDTAFSRICCEELGRQLARGEARFAGVFEHFYDTNFRGTAGATTHYIVHAYRLRAEREALDLPAQQHSCYLWMPPEAALHQAGVHPYTKAYFQN